MKRNGMGIMELVAALGIVALLAVLLLPLLGKTTTRMDDMKCLSNLRQIGLGTLAYVNDHDSRLPGPLYSGQYGWWGGSVNGGDRTQLASYIVDYLALDKTRRKLNHMDVFVCPANKRALNHNFGDTPVYRVNVLVPLSGEETPQAPFGYPNSLYPTLFNTRYDFPPMFFSSLGNIVDESGRSAMGKTWAIKDIDAEDPFFDEHTAEYRLPPQKVHYTHRNALFFDFHVERVDMETSLSSSQP